MVLRVKNLNMREFALGFPKTDYPQLDILTEQVEPFQKLWTMIGDFRAASDDWMNTGLQVEYCVFLKKYLRC